MRHPGMFKPESIANRQPQIQIMDTHEPSETRASIGLAANCHQISRTLLSRIGKPPFAVWSVPMRELDRCWMNFGFPS